MSYSREHIAQVSELSILIDSLIIRETTASSRYREVVKRERNDRSAPAIVGWWWAFWIISGFLGQAAFRTAMRAESFEEYRGACYASIVHLSETIPISLVALMMVKGLYAAQERHSMLGEGFGASLCPSCGEEFDPGSRVCGMCGANLPRIPQQVGF